MMFGFRRKKPYREVEEDRMASHERYVERMAAKYDAEIIYGTWSGPVIGEWIRLGDYEYFVSLGFPTDRMLRRRPRDD